ncbi:MULTISPECIES: TIGR02391 family protein [Halobacterium]|uniref:TIGR02391 family protein n=1 Tax=Halobacterium TaxID=2239 RepID=UPI0009E8B52F|nr:MULTISPECIES: TIGR02391 family protein [Halobacterium]MCG1001873.1 TIGR02391 family protein [Halobacterium noricense]
MIPDRLETHLESVNYEPDWNHRVTLHITAFMSHSGDFSPNTIIFNCDPLGSNYSRVVLEAEFEDRSQFGEIREFLVHHLKQDDQIHRSLELSLNNGVKTTTSHNGTVNRSEGLDELTIEANHERISFGPLGTMSPDIYYYEERDDSGDEDRRNAEELLAFFDEIRSSSEAELDSVPLHDGELVERCLPLFEQENYHECTRLAGQILEERVREIAPESLSDYGGSKLFREAFAPDNGEVQIASDSGEQSGIMAMFQGVYKGIRNPLSHRTPDPEGEEYLDGLDATQAMNILHIVDYLLTTLDRNIPSK